MQVTLEHLDAIDESKTEIVHAKFVVGADGEPYPTCSRSSIDIQFVGAHSWVRKALGIEMEGEQTGDPTGWMLSYTSNQTEQTPFGE